MKNFPWLFSRLNLICKSLIDLFIISFIFFISQEFNYSNLLELIYFSFLWIISSYIIGRYDSCLIGFKSKLREIIKIIFLFFLVLLFTRIFFLFITFKYKWIFTISILSFLFQLKIETILNHNKRNQNIVFIGSQNSLNLFKEQLNLMATESTIKHFKNNVEAEFLQKEIYDYNLIIIEDLKSISKETFNFLQKQREHGKMIYTLLSWFEIIGQRFPPKISYKEEFLINSYLINKNNIQKRIKRFGDISLTLALIIITIPFLIISALLIYLEDGAPIFFKQVRSGYLQNNFEIYKLRTMIKNAEKNGPQWASKKDNRITKVGNILRKLRIDELPQLLNVLKGEMSLIGPRPERPEIDKLLIEKIKGYSFKYSIKPGLSGWAQVNYPYGASIEDADFKLSYDFFYIKNFSILLDILIMLKTIKLVCNAKGSIPRQK